MARLAALSLLLSAAGGSGGAFFYDAETARVTASPLPRAPAPAWLRPLARDGVGSAERAAAHKAGERLSLEPCATGRGREQRWELVPAEASPTSFRLRLSSESLCIDLHNSASQGTLQLRACTTGNDTQQLLTKYAGGSICTASPDVQCDGQTPPTRVPCCLTVDGGSIEPGAALNVYAGVQPWPCEPACVNQQFDWVPANGSSAVELRAKNEGFCVTAGSASPPPPPPPPPPSPSPSPPAAPPTMGVVSNVTCAVRRFALEYGSHLLNGSDTFAAAMGPRMLHEALALQECGHPPPPIDDGQADIAPELDAVAGISVYVAPTGSDTTGDGSEAKPLATLARARDRLRDLRKGWTSSTCRPATVLISTGIYHLNETLELGPSDGGLSAACRVLYRPSQAGETVTVSGGFPLKDLQWRREPEAGNVWSAALPQSAPAEFASLFDEDGARLTRARWPNGSPETDLQPTGYALAAKWLPPKQCPAGVETTIASPQRRLADTGFCENFPAFSTWSGGPAECRGFSPSKMFNETIRSDISTDGPPSGIALDWEAGWANRTWDAEALEGAVVHVMNTNAKLSTDGPWGNFQFAIAGLQRKGSASPSADCASSGCLHFGAGGWQVQSDGPSDEESGTPTYFVENLRAELDERGEWFASTGAGRRLYLIPNTTDGKPPSLLVASGMKTLLKVAGSQQRPVWHLTLQGLTLAHSDVTYMERYTATGPGDWTIYRGGAVVLEGVEEASLERCHLRRLNGNAVFLSGYVRGTNVSGCYFESIGDSCVAAVGAHPFEFNQTAGEFPQHNRIEANIMHSFGVYGKQTSGYFQSLAAGNLIARNIMMNGPRAGVCFGTGFAGANVLEDNLLFNLVQETHDHGPVNGWDRAPYLTTFGAATPHAGIYKQRDIWRRNFVIRGYPQDASRQFSQGYATLVNDDGSSFNLMQDNFLAFGGVQNFLGGGHNISGNLFLYPSSLQPSGFLCLSAGPNIDQTGPSGIRFDNNTCITTDAQFYKISGLSAADVIASDNSLLSPLGTFEQDGANGSLSAWQQQGFDAGSHTGRIPPVDDILAHGRRLLRMPQPAEDPCSGCQMYISGDADLVCTSQPPSVLAAAHEFGFGPEVYVPRPPDGWESLWHCNQSSLPKGKADTCKASAKEPSLLLKLNWPHKSDSPDVPWEQPYGCKGGVPVNRPSFSMNSSSGGPASVGVPQLSFGGGIEGHTTEGACAGRGILYSSRAAAARTDPTAANASAMWWMCGEFSPRRAMEACAQVDDCMYIARHESGATTSRGGSAVHLDPALDVKGCIEAAPDSAACKDPALPMLWFFFDGCADCGGREWITPADGWVSCAQRNSSACGGLRCRDATGGNMLRSGAEYWMWSGSPTWRKVGERGHGEATVAV